MPSCRRARVIFTTFTALDHPTRHTSRVCSFRWPTRTRRLALRVVATITLFTRHRIARETVTVAFASVAKTRTNLRGKLWFCQNSLSTLNEKFKNQNFGHFSIWFLCAGIFIWKLKNGIQKFISLQENCENIFRGNMKHYWEKYEFWLIEIRKATKHIFTKKYFKNSYGRQTSRRSSVPRK